MPGGRGRPPNAVKEILVWPRVWTAPGQRRESVRRRPIGLRLAPHLPGHGEMSEAATVGLADKPGLALPLRTVRTVRDNFNTQNS